MANREDKEYLSFPRWNQFSFLVHGFGLARLTARRLKSLWPGFAVVTTRQTHSDRVNFIDRAPDHEPMGDGLATDKPGLFLVIKTADCLPILLVDDQRRVIAALHCGWRGTAQRLAEKGVTALHERYGCEPRALLAAFGPCIGRYCYEVGEDVRTRFAEEGLALDDFEPHPQAKGKYLLDLHGANRFQLIRAGLDPGNMNFIGDCSHCEPRMSSFRRERQKAGRMLSFIGLRPGA